MHIKRKCSAPEPQPAALNLHFNILIPRPMLFCQPCVFFIQDPRAISESDLTLRD
ncbi:hypothetical protein I79_023703 [Cricetulus griseus]|uniref:Uncharacterized protein n=1 Tax=Cricetulus griseus TaxID=10029 RepID=G3IIN0_CRIGR|nr:hypothetical protein I79_023703 [Cricetulus griseus]